MLRNENTNCAWDGECRLLNIHKKTQQTIRNKFIDC